MTSARRGFLLLAPTGVYLLVVVGGSLLLALYLSSTDAGAGSLSGEFVGAGNFARAWGDPVVRGAVRNTVLVAFVAQSLATVLGLVLAWLLRRPFRGRTALLFLILLPWAAPVALGTLGWKWILDSLFSVLNWALHAAHLLAADNNPQWLGRPSLAMMAIIAVETWRAVPFATVVLLAGLACLPSEVEDAARVDGAGRWGTLIHVTIPLLAPVIVITWLIGVIFSASGMAVVQVLTGGGPFNSTHLTSSLAFQTGIVSGELGPGAAVSLLALPLLAAASVLVLRVARHVDVGF